MTCHKQKGVVMVTWLF